jgi:hypothetical protein
MKAAANRAIVGSQIRQAAAAGMRGSTPFGSPFPHFTFSRRYSAAHLRPPPLLPLAFHSRAVGSGFSRLSIRRSASTKPYPEEPYRYRTSPAAKIHSKCESAGG